MSSDYHSIRFLVPGLKKPSSFISIRPDQRLDIIRKPSTINLNCDHESGREKGSKTFKMFHTRTSPKHPVSEEDKSTARNEPKSTFVFQATPPHIIFLSADAMGPTDLLVP